MATPTFVAAGVLKSAASGNLASVAFPAGIATGDILVMVVAQGDNVAPTVAGGLWTKKDDLTNGANARLSFWWSRYTSGDTAPTVTRAAGDSGIARIAGFNGCITTGDPFVATGASQANGAISTVNSTVAIPSMTPGNGDLVLLIGGAFNTDTSTNLSFSAYTGSPTPTERIDSPVTAPGVQEIGEFLATFTSDGTATGARTATTTNSAAVSTLSVGMAYALRGASAAASRAVTFGPRRTQARRVGPQSFVEQRSPTPPPAVVAVNQNNQSLPFFGVGS